MYCPKQLENEVQRPTTHNRLYNTKCMQITERDRLMNTSTNNMRGKKAERHADQNNQLSSSLTQRLLSNKELRGVLADEIKTTGVLTATGYQAVLQKNFTQRIRSERDNSGRDWR
mmetsp:Transcript_14092/g.28714  ORF Transcript_14092/g.28714 Transcript_14092/m.28714 type:complete len:115 (+) Transcript_14092:69-413(+)